MEAGCFLPNLFLEEGIMKAGNRWIWLVVILFIIGALLSACGGGPPPVEATGEAETGGATGGETGNSSASIPTLAPVGPTGLYTGKILPNRGEAALYIHADNSIEMILVTDDVENSKYLTGTLEGQTIKLESDVGKIRASGRARENVEMTVTLPGVGFLRVPMTLAPEGTAMYTGTLNDLGAGLIAMADGTKIGFAPVKGGDEPEYEKLCVEGGESTPDSLTAQTCDTKEDITLNIVKD